MVGVKSRPFRKEGEREDEVGRRKEEFRLESDDAGPTPPSPLLNPNPDNLRRKTFKERARRVSFSQAVSKLFLIFTPRRRI